jgi:hypothetical protein
MALGDVERTCEAVPAVERIVYLADQDYDRDRPEIPGDMHAERKALAREVLALTKRLDKAATPGKRKPATVAAPAYSALRSVLQAVARELDVQVSARLTRATSLPPATQSRTKTREEKRAKKAPKSLGCAVPDCAAKPQWKLACQAHLKSLPAKLRDVVMDRGSRGRAKPGWDVAADKARKLLGRP